MFKFARVMGMTLGVAVQAMLGGMPVPRDLHRDDVDGQVIITVGSAVLFSYDAADAGLRNLAAVTLPEMGFTGRRVAQVLGITEVYVSMLRTRARAEGSAGLMHRRGRPAAPGARAGAGPATQEPTTREPTPGPAVASPAGSGAIGTGSYRCRYAGAMMLFPYLN